MKSTTRGTLAAVVTAVAAVAGAAAATPAVAADHHDVELVMPLSGNETVEAGAPGTHVMMPLAERSVDGMVNNDLQSAMLQETGAIVGTLPHLLVPEVGKTVIESDSVHTGPGRVGLDLPRV